MKARKQDEAPYLTEDELRAIREVKKRLRRLVGERLRAFLLFGTKARGDHEAGSDTDMSIVIAGLDRETRRRVLDAVVEVEVIMAVPLSTHIFSEEEFAALKNRERRLALDIEREGIPL